MDTHPQTLGHDTLLLMPEIAVVMRSSVKTVRRRIMTGKLPDAFKEGGRWVIWESKLLAHLKAGVPHA